MDQSLLRTTVTNAFPIVSHFTGSFETRRRPLNDVQPGQTDRPASPRKGSRNIM